MSNLTKHIQDELKKRGRKRDDSFSEEDEETISDFNNYKNKAMKMRRTHSLQQLIKKHETITQSSFKSPPETILSKFKIII